MAEMLVADEDPNPAMSSELPPYNAERVLAEALVKRMERHLERFGQQEIAFNCPNQETLCVPVLQRAARLFWHRHPTLWPRFILSGTGGISIEFRTTR